MSDRQKAKKEAEAAAVRELVHLCNLPVVGEPVAGESPDFRLELSSGARVGLEVTELADPRIAEGAAANQRLEAALTDRLRREDLHVAIHLGVPEGFAPLLAPGDVLRQHVDALVSLVRVHLQERRGDKKYTLDELRPFGVSYLADVTVREGSFVTIGHRASGRRSPFVQGCIDAKSSKAATYRARLDVSELWLLLLAGVGFRSGVWSAEIEGQVFASAFDRIFCLDAFEKRAFEVATRRS
jgi:hypothetical protein